MTLARAVPALIDRDDPIPGNQPRGHHLPLTRMTGQAVQQHDRLPRPAPVPAGKPNPVAHHHTLGPPPGIVSPRSCPDSHEPRSGPPFSKARRHETPATSAATVPCDRRGQLPLSDPGGSITEVNALRRPQLTSVANEEEHSPCDCIA